MTLTLHRSECALYRGDALFLAWRVYRFEPGPRALAESPSGFLKVRSASEPIAVEAPPGCRLERGRLVTPRDPYVGLDADSVAFLASKGERGFRLAAGEVAVGAC